MLTETAANAPAVIALAVLLAAIAVSAMALKGWQGWLDLKTRELESGAARAGRGPDRDQGDIAGIVSPHGLARIEISDLKERIRRLEAIAAGVDM